MSDQLDIRHLSSLELAVALDEIGIGNGWVVAKIIRERAPVNSQDVILHTLGRRDSPNQAFRNLVVGRIAERIFREQYLAPLEQEGFVVADLHEQGENRDFVLEKDRSELPINVKTASTMFRNAKEVVGLAAEDCIPISAYKAIGACERVPDLIYVDLVDFALREKVDNFTGSLIGAEEILWELLSWYGGTGARRAQDEYLARLFSLHGPELIALVPEANRYRVISAQRVLAIMRDIPRRCPGLGVRAAGMGVFNAEVNIHVSVAKETVAWDDIVGIVRDEGIDSVLQRIRHRVSRRVPAPTI